MKLEEQMENIIVENTFKMKEIDRKLVLFENVNTINEKDSAEIVGDCLSGKGYDEFEDEFAELQDESHSFQSILESMRQRDFKLLDSTQGAYLSIAVNTGRIKI